MKKITPCDIIISLNKTKKKKIKVPRKTIRRLFFIDENHNKELRNSAKNYLTEFANINYNKKYIVFSSI